MHNLLNKIPDTVTLMTGSGISWDKASLQQRIRLVRAALQARRQPGAPVAILADNSPEWIAIDMATQEAGVALVPLPSFFTPAQWVHAIEASGVQAIFCMQPQHAQALGFAATVPYDGTLALYEAERDKVQENAQAGLEGIQKITFTSGTTSQPKGVCLSTAQQWELASVLHAALDRLRIRRHLSLLPFAVLLENIAGAYTALLSGAAHVCPPLAETGLAGASGFDPNLCLDAIARYQAESVILLPQMLQALVAATGVNDERIRSLRFVAVGGARTPVAWIRAAREKGFPVFEGYGLSECGSVVSLNLPGVDRPGSAGKPLPNRKVRIAADGEIEVGGQGSARYLGQPPSISEWLATGDIGHLDDDGFLFVDGRKKNLLITGFGRNVSPEWPESVLLGTGQFAQAVVFGDAQPYLVAVLVPFAAQPAALEIQRAVNKANQALPDYARIQRWIVTEPFSPASGLGTANGRPRRDAIWQRYQQQIVSLYETSGE